jgi:hypothetical protein
MYLFGRDRHVRSFPVPDKENEFNVEQDEEYTGYDK